MVGVTVGNIIAVIITTQIPRNQPRLPRLVHGPASMPCISRTVHTQLIAATAKSTATRPQRARAAAYAGARPVLPPCATGDDAMGSGSPGELGLGQSRLALVGDAEGVDARARRLGHGEVGPDRVEHAVEADRPTGLHAERHDVLDLEVDGVGDLDAVKQPVVVDLDGGAFGAA